MSHHKPHTCGPFKFIPWKPISWLFLRSHQHVICNICFILETRFCVPQLIRFFVLFFKKKIVIFLLWSLLSMVSELQVLISFNTNCNKTQMYASIPCSSLFWTHLVLNISSYSYFLCLTCTCLLVFCLLLWAYLETLHSKSMPSCRESTKQLADPNEDRECLAMSAPFISFSIARALQLTSCLKVLHHKHKE